MRLSEFVASASVGSGLVMIAFGTYMAQDKIRSGEGKEILGIATLALIAVAFLLVSYIKFNFMSEYNLVRMYRKPRALDQLTYVMMIVFDASVSLFLAWVALMAWGQI